MPAVQATTFGHTVGSQSSLTLASHAVPAGTDRCLAVLVATWGNRAPTATWDGVDLVRAFSEVRGNFEMHLFTYPGEPPNATSDVVISVESNTWIAAAAHSLDGAPGSITAVTCAHATSTAPSVTVASATGHLVLDLVAAITNNVTFTVGAGQTSLYEEDSIATTDVRSAGSSEAGAASVTMSWTLSASGQWAIMAVSIADTGEPDSRLSHAAAEVMEDSPVGQARVSHVHAEVLEDATASPASGWLSHVFAEVMFDAPTPPGEGDIPDPTSPEQPGFLFSHWHLFQSGFQALNSSNIRYAWMFRAPKAGVLNRAGFRFTAAVTPNTMKASWQDVHSSAIRPDETIDQFRTFTPAVGWITTGLITADGTDGGGKRTVAKGEFVCLVLEWDGAAGSVQLQPWGNTNEHWKPNVWHSLRGSGGAWNSPAGLATGNFAVQYDDGVWAYIDGALPVSADGTHTFGNASTPDEIGLRFQAPFEGAIIRGVHARIDTDGAVDVKLYDSADNVLSTCSLTNASARASTSSTESYFPFPDAVELTAGEVYRITFTPTSATTIALPYIDVALNEHLAAWPLGIECYQTSRTNAGAWTDTTTRRPSINLLWSDEIPLFVEPPAAPSEEPIAILEMCFGKAPSGRPGYRNWIKEHANVIAHWYLSDVGPVGATDEIFPNDAGTYLGAPGKGRGLLPEFGLSTRFDGIDDAIEVDYDFFGLDTDDPFTIGALIRPREITSAANRCIHCTGTNGAYLGIDTTGHVIFGKNSGTRIALSEVIAAEGEYLVIGRFDGTTARLNVWNLKAVRSTDPRKRGELLGTANSNITIGPHGASDAFIGKRTSEEFYGDIQGVFCIGASLSDNDCEELLECATWTDVTGDARTDVPIECVRGLLSDSPDTRLAPVGTLTFALNNAENNEGDTRSWYSPGHANCREGFTRGIPVRALIGNEVVGSVQHFIGTLVEITPTTGIREERLTYCIAYDWMNEAAKFNLQGIETQENITADEVITLILMRMDNKPHDIDFDAGSDLYPIALDNTQDENAFAQSEFSKLMLSELGLLFVTGLGTLRFENRSSRGTITTISATFDNSMEEATVDASTTQIINRVRVTVHPRRVDAAATTVLYESSNRLALDAGETETFLQFRDPTQQAKRFGGLDVNTPAATTDYTINTAEDGSGLDVTLNPNISLSFEISGSGIYMTVANNYGARVYIMIQVTGRGVYDYEPVTVIEKNTDSIKAIGVNEVSIDMPYQSSVPIGQGAALQILNVFQNEDPRMKSLVFQARKSVENLELAIQMEISQRVIAIEEQTGVDGEFFVNGVRLMWSKDKQIYMELFLTPADTNEYWILDTSELDITTRLGFA